MFVEKGFEREDFGGDVRLLRSLETVGSFAVGDDEGDTGIGQQRRIGGCRVYDGLKIRSYGRCELTPRAFEVRNSLPDPEMRTQMFLVFFESMLSGTDPPASRAGEEAKACADTPVRLRERFPRTAEDSQR